MSFFKRWFASKPAQDPADRLISRLLGPDEVKGGEALALLSTIGAADPTNGEAQLGLGMLRLRDFTREPRSTALHDAVVHLAQAAQLLPDSAEAHFYLALAQSFTLDTVDEAERNLQRALELNPSLEASSSEIRERITAAKAGMQQQAIDPETLHAAVQRYEQAQSLAGAGRFEDARAKLLEAVELYPAYAEALLALGEVYRRLKREDDAITAFRRALAVRPHMFQAHVGLGSLYVGRGDHERALGQLLLALDQAPDQPQVLLNVGLLQLATNKPADAAMTFRRLCALQPNDPGARLQLALAAVQAGDNSTARDALQRCLGAELTPRQRSFAAQIAGRLGDPELVAAYPAA